MVETRFSIVPLTSEEDTQSKQMQQSSERPLSQDASAPRTVKRDLAQRASDIAVDLFLFACCIAFLVFAGLAKSRDKARIEDDASFNHALLQASQYGPTVFPILFAAIGGRTIKAFIQWRLQRGERLQTLDLLCSSTTVTGAITAQVTVRKTSFLGIALIVLWALSPVGGQASLRILSRGNDTTTIPVRYFRPSDSIYFWTSGSNAGRRTPLLNSMWFTLLLGNQESRSATVDTWGNVKIPMIEPLEADQLADNEGWFSVPQNTTDYASLVGIPVSPRPKALTISSLNIETWYWALDCFNLTSDRMWILQEGYGPYSNSSQSKWKTGYCNQALVGCLVTNQDNNSSVSRRADDPKVPFRQILFSTEDYSFEGDHTNLQGEDGYDSQSGGVCNMSTTYVEARVDCIGRDCAVRRVRRSLLPPTVPAWTVFDCVNCSEPLGSPSYQGGNIGASGALQFMKFATLFTTSLQPSASNPTAVSAYMANPISPFDSNQHPPASTLPHRTYSMRLAQLLNTYWGALGGTSTIINGIGDRNGSDPSTFWDVPFKTTSTQGTMIVPNALLECHNGWLAATVIASGTLLLLCLVAPLLRVRTANPELSLNFSSLLRDNAYVLGSESSTSLQAHDRARLLGGTKIKFGDVKPEEDVGHLTLASSNLNTIRRVQNGKKYS